MDDTYVRVVSLQLGLKHDRVGINSHSFEIQLEQPCQRILLPVSWPRTFKRRSMLTLGSEDWNAPLTMRDDLSDREVQWSMITFDMMSGFACLFLQHLNCKSVRVMCEYKVDQAGFVAYIDSISLYMRKDAILRAARTEVESAEPAESDLCTHVHNQLAWIFDQLMYELVDVPGGIMNFYRLYAHADLEFSSYFSAQFHGARMQKDIRFPPLNHRDRQFAYGLRAHVLHARAKQDARRLFRTRKKKSVLQEQKTDVERAFDSETGPKYSVKFTKTISAQYADHFPIDLAPAVESGEALRLLDEVSESFWNSSMPLLEYQRDNVLRIAKFMDLGGVPVMYTLCHRLQQDLCYVRGIVEDSSNCLSLVSGILTSRQALEEFAALSTFRFPLALLQGCVGSGKTAQLIRLALREKVVSSRSTVIVLPDNGNIIEQWAEQIGVFVKKSKRLGRGRKNEQQFRVSEFTFSTVTNKKQFDSIPTSSLDVLVITSRMVHILLCPGEWKLRNSSYIVMADEAHEIPVLEALGVLYSAPLESEIGIWEARPAPEFCVLCTGTPGTLESKNGLFNRLWSNESFVSPLTLSMIRAQLRSNAQRPFSLTSLSADMEYSNLFVTSRLDVKAPSGRSLPKSGSVWTSLSSHADPVVLPGSGCVLSESPLVVESEECAAIDEYAKLDLASSAVGGHERVDLEDCVHYAVSVEAQHDEIVALFEAQRFTSSQSAAIQKLQTHAFGEGGTRLSDSIDGMLNERQARIEEVQRKADRACGLYEALKILFINEPTLGWNYDSVMDMLTKDYDFSGMDADTLRATMLAAGDFYTGPVDIILMYTDVLNEREYITPLWSLSVGTYGTSKNAALEAFKANVDEDLKRLEADYMTLEGDMKVLKRGIPSNIVRPGSALEALMEVRSFAMKRRAEQESLQKDLNRLQFNIERIRDIFSRPPRRARAVPDADDDDDSDDDDRECPVCAERQSSAISSCGHLACMTCWNLTLRPFGRCHTCRQTVRFTKDNVQRTLLYSLPSTSSSDAPDDFVEFRRLYGSKLAYAAAHMRQKTAAGESCLCMIEWSTTTKVFSGALQKMGVPTLHLSGSAQQRHVAIRKFWQAREAHVLMLTVGDEAGMNLVKAQNIYFLHPLTMGNRSEREEQCVARAHRLGQTGVVSVYHFYFKDTVEETAFWSNGRARSLYLEKRASELVDGV